MELEEANGPKRASSQGWRFQQRGGRRAPRLLAEARRPPGAPVGLIPRMKKTNQDASWRSVK